MPGTNTLAFYENPEITDKKSFITLGPGRSGRILTLDLRIVRRVFYHCPTEAQLTFYNILPEEILMYYFLLVAAATGFKTSNFRSRVNCSTIVLLTLSKPVFSL